MQPSERKPFTPDTTFQGLRIQLCVIRKPVCEMFSTVSLMYAYLDLRKGNVSVTSDFSCQNVFILYGGVFYG